MFAFKKFVAQFITPVSLTFELLVVGILLLFFTKRQKTGRILILITALIYAFCSYTSTSDFLIYSLKKKYPPLEHSYRSDFSHMPKMVVVLGGGSSPNSSLPVVSRADYDTLVRLIEGIRIYRMIPGSKLVLSGGRPSSADSTAEIMAEIAEGVGVNEDDIILETESRDTKDEARIIHSMLGDRDFILVTSAAHMPRAIALFKKLGMKPIPAPTISIEERLLYRWPNPFIPSSVNLQKAEMAFHNYLGIIWAWFRGQL